MILVNALTKLSAIMLAKVVPFGWHFVISQLGNVKRNEQGNKTQLGPTFW